MSDHQHEWKRHMQPAGTNDRSCACGAYQYGDMIAMAQRLRTMDLPGASVPLRHFETLGRAAKLLEARAIVEPSVVAAPVTPEPSEVLRDEFYRLHAEHAFPPELRTFMGKVWRALDARGVPVPASPEQLAQRFHETYERLAPAFGYETRRESAKPWADVPEQNRRLMTAVCAEILRRGTDRSPADRDAPLNRQMLEGLLLTWCAEDDHEPVLYEGDVEWVERFAQWLDKHGVTVASVGTQAPEPARIREALEFLIPWAREAIERQPNVYPAAALGIAHAVALREELAEARGSSSSQTGAP